ncbi:MAG: TRAP transporter large permease [Proteobacteria bacterium]|nr:TRAP transporter large permease [Pseudomonadota bacterium]MDA0868064.1 TRAP transporter large permease [Pseudomonadota bacterium]MDA1327315.1 TRAP transporter large permease [Pseudomonadota bacterium]
MFEAMLGFGGLVLLTLLRVPLAFAMAISATVGLAVMRGWPVAWASAEQVIQETGFAYTLSVVPLFVLMGNFVARAGLAQELFDAAHSMIGHVKGGLAHATVLACAGFGAICGSSLATAATMSRVAYPSMKKLGYSEAMASGVVATGGTLGIMIPPSTILVIYGIITETNIGELFAAGVLPGILTASLLMAGITIMAWLDPEHAPADRRYSWAERWRALRGIWGVLVLALLVLGGIYGGVFTPTEGAGFGAAGAFAFAWLRGKLTWRLLFTILADSARTTSMIFALLIGALMFANFMNFTSLPFELKDGILGLGLSPIMVVVAMMFVYVALGMVLEELTMVLLTIPLFFPIVFDLGFDPVWFGVLITMVVQIGLVSPPVGMNLFVIHGLLPGVGLTTIYRGVWILVVAMVVALGILIAYPEISLALPTLLLR